MKKPSIILLLSIPLIILWSYTAISKVSDFPHFRTQMMKQVFSEGFAEALAYTLPLTELIVAGLLCFALTRIYGFISSAFLLLSFSIYIALILAGVFGKTPCSCGGVLSQLGWGEHLIFNLVFLALALLGVFLSFKKGGMMEKR